MIKITVKNEQCKGVVSGDYKTLIIEALIAVKNINDIVRDLGEAEYAAYIGAMVSTPEIFGGDLSEEESEKETE